MNLNTEIRLTDELERQLMLDAVAGRSETLQVIPFLKSCATALVRGIDKVLKFIGNLNDAMDRAHARSSQFAGSQW